MASSSKFKSSWDALIESTSPYISKRKAEDLVIEPCDSRAIKPSPPLRVRVGERFQLMYYGRTDFRNLFVMGKEDYDVQLPRLKERISEVVEKDLKLEWMAEKSEVVLAPYPNYHKHPNHRPNDYHRAYVVEVNFADADARNPSAAGSTALVSFFDMGGCYEVKLKDLKPVTKPIMEVPLLSYKVAVYTEGNLPFDDQGLIICTEFSDFMKKLIKKAELIINPFRVRADDDSTTDPMANLDEQFGITPAVIQYVIKKTAQRPLTMTLDEMKIWEWERKLKSLPVSRNPRGVYDDTLTCAGQFGKAERAIDYFQLTAGTSFTAEVTKTFETEDEPGLLKMAVILLNDDVHHNYHRVLHNQMDHYTKLVCQSWFYPAIKQVFMLRLNWKKELQGIIQELDKWCRAVLMDENWMYLIDWDTQIPFDGAESMDYDIRPLYGEFLQVPTLALTILPTANGNIDVRMPLEKGEELFTVGQRYEFKVPKAGDNNGMVGLVEYPKWSGEKPKIVKKRKGLSRKNFVPSDTDSSSISTSSSSVDDESPSSRNESSSSTSTSSESSGDGKPEVVEETNGPLVPTSTSSSSSSCSSIDENEMERLSLLRFMAEMRMDDKFDDSRSTSSIDLY